MADSSIAITQGSGTSIDTFTQSDGTHRQGLVIGDRDYTQTARVGAEGALWVSPRGGQRWNSTYYVEAATITATEAAVAMARNLAGTTTAATTSGIAVTSGRTFRMQNITASVTLLGTTVASGRVRIRTGSATGPIIASFRVGNWSIGTQAANYTSQTISVPIPDALEIDSATTIFISAVATTASMLSLDMNLLGYEYPATVPNSA